MFELCVRDKIIFVLFPDVLRADHNEIGLFRNMYRCCMSSGIFFKNREREREREEGVCKVKELNKLRAVTNR